MPAAFSVPARLLEKDQLVLDLQLASEAIHGHARIRQRAGTGGSRRGPRCSARPGAAHVASAVLARADVHLCAPIQPPPQIRDCSCFELHLRQSFAAARRLRVAREPDPEAAFKSMNTRADDRVIDTFNRQPIYYKGNRFAVIGPDDDVIWPSYSKAMDFELELGCYIGKKGKDIPRDKARDHILAPSSMT
jgi:2-keto-4-pentenoate hydratase/2-oxohepta-3-ene-1,7-dioic acid hydratase in catechol pathway